MSLMVVVGSRDTTISGSEASVWAYNENSELQWTYDTGGDANDVVLDSSDNIYIVGTAADNGDENGTRNLWKLDSSGNYLGGRYVNSATFGNALCLDSIGRIIVGTSMGAHRVAVNLASEENINFDVAETIAVDVIDDSIYVGSGGTPKNVIKYNSSLVAVPGFVKDPQTSKSCWGLAILSNQDIIACIDNDVYYYKSDGTGGDSGEWSVSLGDTGSLCRVAVDSNDLVYLVKHNVGGDRDRLYCLNDSGIEQWKITHGADLENIFINSSNEVFCCGDRVGSVAAWKEESQSLVEVIQSPSILLKGICGTSDIDLVPPTVKMDYYVTGEDGKAGVYDTRWEGQTFTPTEDHTIKSVKLLLSADVDVSGDIVTVSIRNTSGGKPIGIDLCSGTLAGNLIGIGDGNKNWHEVTLGDGTPLTSGNQYVICVRSSRVDAKIVWWDDITSPTYTGGTRVNSNNSGVDWYDPTTGHDFLFETFRSAYTAPKITDQSSSITIILGEEATLSVTATGVPAPTYQWYKDDIAISGKTASTLVFVSDDNSAGVYKCRVGNIVDDDVWSDPIVLTVYIPPTITDQSSSITIILGEEATLSVTATGVPAPTYQWYEDGGIISGEMDSTIVVSPTSTTIYTCTVTNAGGDDTSDPITVTVIGRPLDKIELVSQGELSISALQAVGIDLLQLVPEKFKGSAILREYLEEAGIQISSWLTNVKNIVKLLSPNTVGTIQYLRYLGMLIGVEFSPEDETTESSLRKELANAIDWYKLKGTYESIQILSLIQQHTVNFYDMYTADYSTFYLTDWFVGEEDENPPGFDATYYKSPHFGLEVLLNKVFEVGSILYLWRSTYLDNMILQVEKTRPVHTVPHYLLLLNPKTDELGHIIEVDGEIKTKVLGQWQYSTKYFDMTESNEIWYFDDGIYFDQSAEGFIKSITRWVLGTGGSYDVDIPVLEGVIDTDDITITDEKIVFEFIVPKSTVQDGINELGLYIPGSGNDPVLASIFPIIDKSNSVELRVLVEVYKKDLSPEEVVPESGEAS